LALRVIILIELVRRLFSWIKPRPQVCHKVLLKRRVDEKHPY
jgi:hypothetical protein